MRWRGPDAPATATGDHDRSSPLLRVEDLEVTFDTPKGRLHAVDGVSLELGAGKTLGIVGESGSGKSMLVRATMRLVPRGAHVSPGSRVEFDGRALNELRERDLRDIWGREMALIFQDSLASLTPVLRVGRQLVEPMRVHLDLGRAEAKQRALELLALVNIADPERRFQQYPHALSGGMRQRVAIAIALACSPKLLVADEPTTALDVTVEKQVLNLIARLQAQLDMSVVLISHDLTVVAGRTDDVAVMYAGRIIEQGPTRAVFHQPRHPYTEALLESIPRLDGAAERLRAIPGRPATPLGPTTSCRFAPRCDYAQPRCLEEVPPLDPVPGSRRAQACFFPAGTEAGEAALAHNRAEGRTASGRVLQDRPNAATGGGS